MFGSSIEQYIYMDPLLRSKNKIMLIVVHIHQESRTEKTK
jgi:hypothetical protein